MNSTRAGGTVWGTFRAAPLPVKTILAGVFVNSLGGFLNIFLVLYLTSKGYDTERAALALGVLGAGAVLGVLIGGALAERLGARNATVLGMGGTGVLIVSLLFVPRYPLLLAAVLLVGLLGRIARPAAATLLSDLTPGDSQIMIFAMSRFGLNLGAMTAPLLGFALFHLGNDTFDLLFWGEALAALSYATLAFIALPARPARAVRARTGPPGGYLEVLRDRRFTVYLVAMLLHTVVYVQYLSTLPLDIRASGMKIFWYTLAVSLNGFIVIAFELFLTRITQRWPARLTVGLAFALLGVGVAGYGLPLGPTVIVAGTLIWTLGEIIGGPTIFAYPALAAPARLKAHYIGSFQFVYGMGAALGPVVGGWLLVRLGHGVWPVLACGSLLATVLGVVAVRTPGRQPAPALVDAQSGS